MVFKWIATTAFGLENIAAGELRRLKMTDVKAVQGGAMFSGSYRDAYKAMLWLRSADRVILVLKEGAAYTFEDLYQLVLSIPFEMILPIDGSFHVTGKCVRSRLMSVRDCQAITKKAVIDRLRQTYGLDVFPETMETYGIDISIFKDMARITLDAAGQALNKRGYRVFNGEAAIRETLAAALVQLSPWRYPITLHDPCCGTGTLIIEAAMIASDMAPGLNRSFAMEAWRLDNKTFFKSEHTAAVQCRKNLLPLHITGSDIDPVALNYCAQHIKRAGFAAGLHCYQRDLRVLQLHEQNGVFIINPPYGERLSDRRSAQDLHCEIGSLLKRHPGYALCVLSSDPATERLIGRRADTKRRVYNGRIECEYFIYHQR